jgi:hypothetical protein
MDVRREPEFFFASGLFRTDHTNFSIMRRVIKVTVFIIYESIPDQALSLMATWASIVFATRRWRHVAPCLCYNRHPISGSQLFFHLLVNVSHITHYNMRQKVQSPKTRFNQGEEQIAVGGIGGFSACHYRHIAPLRSKAEDQSQGVLFISQKIFRLPRFLGAVAFARSLRCVFISALAFCRARTFFLPRPEQDASRSVESGTAITTCGRETTEKNLLRRISLISPKVSAPMCERKSERVLGLGTLEIALI